MDSDTPIFDALEDDVEPDPPEFDAAKVPLEHADLFRDGRTGRGLTDAEYDETKRRLRKHGGWPFDQPAESGEG